MNNKACLVHATYALNKGQLREAAALCRALLKNDPKASDAWQILSICALEAGNTLNALGLIDKAIFIHPHCAHYFSIRGIILQRAQFYHAAITAMENAVRMDPDSSDFHYNLGTLHQDLGHFIQAKDSYQKALALNPSNPKILMNLAALLRDHQHYEAALQCYDTLLRLHPKYHRALHGKGMVYKHQYDLKTATVYYKQALALDPTNKNYHFSLALAYLHEGHFLEGWREYEYRLQLSPFHSLRSQMQQPQWDGQPLNKDESLLLWAEQGFGDTLTFIRYLPFIQKRCSNIHLLCHPELKSLFNPLPGISSITLFTEKIPQTTYQLPLLSAPHIFKTTRETIPNRVPYLSAPPPINGLLNTHTFNVGIVWSGKPIPDKKRSCDLTHFIPLFAIPGITFYSLQLGEESKQLKEKPFTQYAIEDLSPHMKDFKETATLVTALDLLIAIDTAIVHLAGALNCSTWVLLQKHVDWRWQPQGTTSDWYPSHRLFRQEKQGEWGPVFATVSKALSDRFAPKPCGRLRRPS